MARTSKDKIDYKYNLSTYWSLIKPYKWYFFFMLILIFIMQLENAAEKYLFKLIIDNGTSYSNGTLTLETFTTILIAIAAAFLGMHIILAIVRWGEITLSSYLSAETVTSLKRKYFMHIINLDYNFHTTHKTGSLISKITRGSSALDRLGDTLQFNFIPLLFQIIIATTTLLYFDKNAAIILLTTMTLFVAYSLWIQKKQEPFSMESNAAEDIEKGSIADYLTNIDTIKYFGKEDNVKKKFFDISEYSKTTLKKYWNFFRWTESGQRIIIAIGTLLIIYFPMKAFLAHEITLGTLTFIYTTYVSFLAYLDSFVYGIRGFNRSVADLQPLFAYGKIKNSIKDKRNAEKLAIKEGTIRMKNISFSYKNRTIFDNFSLKINKNEKVALVGHSGSGKTTLVKLLYRFYDVNSGEVLIDGKNIKNFKQESLRSELSIVPQEGILFDDTIYNNIAFSNPKANKKDVWKAIKFAQLDKLIAQLPKKEHTYVGERGVKLSGGERQRVSIARALLADKKILVLDEATSALDSKTEHDIQTDLQKLMKGRTTIIIAHRLSTIMHADKIVVMNKGKIVQWGNHKELIKIKDGPYHKLWNLQKGGYIR